MAVGVCKYPILVSLSRDLAQPQRTLSLSGSFLHSTLSQPSGDDGNSCRSKGRDTGREEARAQRTPLALSLRARGSNPPLLLVAGD